MNGSSASKTPEQEYVVEFQAVVRDVITWFRSMTGAYVPADHSVVPLEDSKVRLSEARPPERYGAVHRAFLTALDAQAQYQASMARGPGCAIALLFGGLGRLANRVRRLKDAANSSWDQFSMCLAELQEEDKALLVGDELAEEVARWFGV